MFVSGRGYTLLKIQNWADDFFIHVLFEGNIVILFGSFGIYAKDPVQLWKVLLSTSLIIETSHLACTCTCALVVYEHQIFSQCDLNVLKWKPFFYSSVFISHAYVLSHRALIGLSMHKEQGHYDLFSLISGHF